MTDQRKNRITAVLNTWNAAEHLERVLTCLKGFDEIVVCDMESTDATREIASRHGCRIVNFPKGEITIVEPARNAAIRAARSEWVLVVDADELVTPELRDYLYAHIAKPDCEDALQIPFRSYFLTSGKVLSYPEYHCRFMRRDCVDWPPTIHAKPVITGRTGRVPAKPDTLAIRHLAQPMKGWFLKMCRYTDNEVVRRAGSGRVTMSRLMFEPLIRFIKHYFLKGGFLRGKSGYVYAQSQCFYRFMVLAKLLDRQLAERNNPEA